jgi:hypothetical protein
MLATNKKPEDVMRGIIEALRGVETVKPQLPKESTVQPLEKTVSFSIKVSNIGILVCDVNTTKGFTPVYAAFSDAEQLAKFVKEAFAWYKPGVTTPATPEITPARQIEFD